MKRGLKETEDQMESVVLRALVVKQEVQAQLDWTAWSVKLENLDPQVWSIESIWVPNGLRERGV